MIDGTVTYGGQPSGRRQRGHRADHARAGRALTREPGIDIRVRRVRPGPRRARPHAGGAGAGRAAALAAAASTSRQLEAIKTHNPFIVNDIVFAREFGIDPQGLNNFGSSLVWGHPQGPTALRSVIELIEELVLLGGGHGLFTGCAAGDSAMAVVLQVDDRCGGESSSSDQYWNAELETKPWREVERWQAQQWDRCCRRSRPLGAVCAPACRARATCRSAASPTSRRCRSRSRTTCAPRRRRATDERPFGENQARGDQADIVQAISSSGTTGAAALLRADRERRGPVGDAVANVWFTAGIRRDDVVAHLVGLPMVAGGLPYADGFRRIGATLCWLGGFPTERILREMRHLRVTALLATTSFAPLSRRSSGTRSAARLASLGAAQGDRRRRARPRPAGAPAPAHRRAWPHAPARDHGPRRRTPVDVGRVRPARTACTSTPSATSRSS